MKRKPKARKSRKTYRVRNWSQYNKALVNRGNLTVWISAEAIKNWFEEEQTGKPGASNTYSAVAIEACLMMRSLFHLALRQTEGFVNALFELGNIELNAPDYSTLSRRLAGLEIKLPVKNLSDKLHVVIDSTGVKVYGEGEWKVRTHGWQKRRTWLKLHLCIDSETHQILSVETTGNNVDDADKTEALLDAIAPDKQVEQVSADGIYDKKKAYQAINKHKARAVIPPRRNAKIWQHGNSKKERLVRDENVRRIRSVGRSKWKEESNYHRRSLAETGVYRYKQTFGARVASRREENQFNEMRLNCKILNRMTHLGMPKSECIAQ
ncbi:MAG: IS5 family transposase [Pyrinomonadaceae bacterium]